MNRQTIAFSVALTAFAVQSALAQAASAGGVDPTTGLTTIGTWILGLTGVAIPIICAVKGGHAVAEGRHLMPYIGAAIGGMVLAFGGAAVLSHYGVGNV